MIYLKGSIPLSACFIQTFRYIELSNGLRALLISDLGQEACVCKPEQSDDDDDDDDDKEEDDSEEEDGGSEEDNDDDRDNNETDGNGEVKKKKKGTSEKQVINLNESTLHQSS